VRQPVRQPVSRPNYRRRNRPVQPSQLRSNRRTKSTLKTFASPSSTAAFPAEFSRARTKCKPRPILTQPQPSRNTTKIIQLKKLSRTWPAWMQALSKSIEKMRHSNYNAQRNLDLLLKVDESPFGVCSIGRTARGNSSVGRASASQAEGRGFESRFPLLGSRQDIPHEVVRANRSALSP